MKTTPEFIKKGRGATYLDLIRRGALQHGPRIAIQFEDSVLTYTQVDHASSQLAHALHESGLQPHDRVGILLNNGLHSVPLDFACVKAALNRVPLNSRLSTTEHVKMLESTRCRFLIFGPDLAARAEEISKSLPEMKLLGLGGQTGAGTDLLQVAGGQPTQGPDVTVDHDDVVLTLFTSGTTGTLKAAQHTQGSYAAICRNVLLNLIQVERDDAMLHAASMIHASGTFVLPFWTRGARTVILPGFEPAGFLKAIEKFGATAINLVPTMLQMLLECQHFSTTDVSTLKSVVYGASPMPRATIERAMAAWGQKRFWQYYGQTEVPLCIAVLRPEDHLAERLSACGQVSLDVEVRLVDESGKDVPMGEPGEILVRSPSTVAQYYDAPELNQQTFDTEGWVHTRDIGQFDQDGFLHLKDRTSDMIISGGYNVYPREVEDALLSHPAVLECGVFGKPDLKWVEAVTAAVVTRTGAEVTEAELIQWVAQRIASYKKPAGC
ncbi:MULTISPECIES: class I adenylate-forming enzyme family protein [Burkholderiales]|uniref:Acyl-CoA synthetase (AMP-forming)/AMP-acid ligase II n=1 Tax=Paraburkholderia fungorum TaxID=134537 RepID=A0AAW3V114_9BURK|nr:MULTISPECIES: AMP-binding protein [Burkholderiales]MBB4515938.1 acyl-CoA synthetase (AMP-forming)/AMP-acid ligase II [Paraburkholderia fungorum]MBB6203646.1 acyl-CoA synthetase (AMP-forming)/AMP-acid ligase II [Paraburkholderia fungorum]